MDYIRWIPACPGVLCVPEVAGAYVYVYGTPDVVLGTAVVVVVV
jgi:hypothetical protein